MDPIDRKRAARPRVSLPQMPPMPQLHMPSQQGPRPHARQASGTPVSHAPSYAQQRAEAERRRAAGEEPIAPTVAQSLRATKTSKKTPRAGDRRRTPLQIGAQLRAVADSGAGADSLGEGAPDGERARNSEVPRSQRQLNVRAVKAVAIAAVCFFAVVALGFCYMTMWRNVKVTVNGKAVQTRIGTTLDELLQANDNFGVQPGRLLSVGGNVLDERGGDHAAVTVDGAAVPTGELAATRVAEGSSLTVANGADATEPHTEEEATVPPNIQMGSGGAIQYVQQWGKAGKKTVWHGERSGETVDHEVTAPAQDMVVASVNPQPKDGKYIALTFDDGPSKYTQAILDILKDKDVKATFYNLGSQAATYPDLVRAVVDDGHELASHTNAHQNLPTLDRDSLRAEISSAFDTLEQGAGARPQMMRAPYGAFTASEWARAGDLISCNVLWNIDTRDWERPGAAAITNTVLSNAYNGAIVLMHDGGGNREQNIQALPGIIDGLRDAGYELVTVGELMRLDGSFPKDVIKGTVKMPKDAVLPQ